MKIKLLKKFRKEAKEKIYIIYKRRNISTRQYSIICPSSLKTLDKFYTLFQAKDEVIRLRNIYVLQKAYVLSLQKSRKIIF